MQRDELGSNSGDLGLKSNLVFQLPNLGQNLPQSHRSITNAHCLTTFDHSASSPPFRIVVLDHTLQEKTISRGSDFHPRQANTMEGDKVKSMQ